MLMEDIDLKKENLFKKWVEFISGSMFSIFYLETWKDSYTHEKHSLGNIT